MSYGCSSGEPVADQSEASSPARRQSRTCRRHSQARWNLCQRRVSRLLLIVSRLTKQMCTQESASQSPQQLKLIYRGHVVWGGCCGPYPKSCSLRFRRRQDRRSNGQFIQLEHFEDQARCLHQATQRYLVSYNSRYGVIS